MKLTPVTIAKSLINQFSANNFIIFKMCLCFPPGDEIGWIHFFVCLAPLCHACPCCFVTRKGSTTVTEWRKMVGSSKWAQWLQSKPFPGASATQGWFEIFQGLLPPRPKCIYFTTVFMCVWFMHAYVPHVLCIWPRRARLHAGQRLTSECLPQSFSTSTLTLFGDWSLSF